MSGRLSQTDYHSIRDEYDPDQSSLFDYGGDANATTVAVVRLPRETGIDEMCDEWWPELGMPEDALKQFWSLRSDYRANRDVDNPDERAFREAGLGPRYREHVRNSDEAQQRLNEAVERLEDGEDLTLVCFEEEGKPCHRHILCEFIENRREIRARSRPALHRG